MCGRVCTTERGIIGCFCAAGAVSLCLSATAQYISYTGQAIAKQIGEQCSFNTTGCRTLRDALASTNHSALVIGIMGLVIGTGVIGMWTLSSCAETKFRNYTQIS